MVVWSRGVGPAKRRGAWSVLVGPHRRMAARLPAWQRPWAQVWSGDSCLSAPVGPHGRVGHARLVVPSLPWLRRLVAEPAAATPIRRLTLVVEYWRAPGGTWSGRIGPLPTLRWHRIVLPPRGAGPVRVELELVRPASLFDLITAVLPVLAPIRPLPRPASADVAAADAVPPWLGTSPNHTVAANGLAANREIRAYDLVLARDPDAVANGRALSGALVAADSTAVRVTPRHPAILVDAAWTNPIGRGRRYGLDAPTARLEVAASGAWRVLGDSKTLAQGSLSDVAFAADRLRPLRYVANLTGGELPGSAPAAEAALVAQLAATGPVLDLPELPASVADLLAAPLRAVLGQPLPDVTADPVEWEIRSVRQRSAALRGHAAAFALGGALGPDFPGLAAAPSVSAILVTRRPDLVPDAVARLAAQTYPQLQIVLCMHGADLADGTRRAVAACGRPIEIVAAPGGLSFGEAMGLATASAAGSLITKVDDDDGYGPHHVWDLVLAREFSGAALVGKAAEFIYLHTLGVTVRREAVPPESYGPPVAGGTMLISRGDLEAIGGWRPVPRSVDRGLMDRVLRAGGLIYRTHPLGYVYDRRADGHTWDPGLDYFLRRGGAQWTGRPPYREFGVAEGQSAAEQAAEPAERDLRPDGGAGRGSAACRPSPGVARRVAPAELGPGGPAPPSEGIAGLVTEQ